MQMFERKVREWEQIRRTHWLWVEEGRGLAKCVGWCSPATITKMLGPSSISVTAAVTPLLTFISPSLPDLRHREHTTTTNAKPITPKIGARPPYRNEAEEFQLHSNFPVSLLPIVSFILSLNPQTFSAHKYRFNSTYIFYIYIYSTRLCFFYTTQPTFYVLSLTFFLL